MRVAARYNLDIFIDGLSIFSTPGCMLGGADIYESVANPIPTCQLEVIVPLSWLDERSVVDGAKIKFSVEFLEMQNPIKHEYKFRIFGIKKVSIDQKFAHLIIEGIADFYVGYQEGNPYNKYALVSDIFKDIAEKNKLVSDIDPTDDKQLWVAGENNIYQFMQYMTEYAYKDETSSFFWCLDRETRLLFKNWTTLFRGRQNNIFTFIQNPNALIDNLYFTYTKAYGSIQSGTNNLNNCGYGGANYQFNLLDYKKKDITARKVIAESQLININKELSKGLSNEWYPFDVGNFHPNFYKARLQNKRIMSTYSTYIRLESQFFQPYRLCQIVNFEYLDSQDLTNKIKCMSGTYMIDAIHITFSTSNITSAIELVMQGLNGKARTEEVY